MLIIHIYTKVSLIEKVLESIENLDETSVISLNCKFAITWVAINATPSDTTVLIKFFTGSLCGLNTPHTGRGG
ncbi:hypothetical protein THERMOS_1414 [Bathymodiolus thermophilus thioautotrophic gill symbiont]|uniref:Uncharacterized protein n=1 Tax=Bathymodiolus thermophilus thioautotrophic gill symbiont TaxID=2360 RepID=A0A8H8XBS8_9GAMM|nr:hypothetical protein THERMOS_1414 [Bathymodiolus thermophilus thioautotrophic gill symbiont]